MPRDTTVHPAAHQLASEYLEVQASPEFQELRSRLRRFVFPMSAFFLLWYSAYVLLGAFAHDFMATKVWGDINVGLIIGLRPVRLHLPHHRALRPVRQPRSSTRAPRPSATSSRTVRHDRDDDPSSPQTARPSATRSPTSASSGSSSSITLFIVIRASKKNATAADSSPRAALHRPAERHRDLR